jgi:hypothetical protein
MEAIGDTIDTVENSWHTLAWLSNDRVLFRVQSHFLAMVTIEGKVPLFVALTSPRSWAVSPDGKEVAYIAWVPETDRRNPKSILYVGPLLADAPPRKVYTGGLMQGVMWTVDGGYLIVNEEGHNTRAFPSEGGPPREYLAEGDAKGSATVRIPPGGPLPNYVPIEPLWSDYKQPAWVRLEPGSEFGRWTVARDGRSLERSGGFEVSHSCRGLLPSPDGRFLACTHVRQDHLRETSESWATIIRIRA